MRDIRQWFFCLLTMGLLLLPINLYAQTPTRRALKPLGQLMGETYNVRSKLRALRLQETRRPRDIQAAPTRNMGNPGRARPTPFVSLLEMERTNATAATGMFGRGMRPSMPAPQWLGPGTNVDGVHSTDPIIVNIEREESNVEWWEMNERSRSQRGGGFRTRFGSRQPAQMTQRQQGVQGGTAGPPGADMGGGAGEVTPFTPGGNGSDGGGAFTPSPGQNMPPGGGGAGMGGMR